MKNMPYDEKKTQKLKLRKKLNKDDQKLQSVIKKKDKHFYGCVLITKNG